LNDWQAIKGLIMDMDGVLWRGAQPLGDLPRLFQQITRYGWQSVLVTNNATRSVDFYLEKLLAFGVQLERWQVISSGEALVAYLTKSILPGATLYVIGEEGLVQLLSQQGYIIGEDHARAVIVSLDRELTYEKLRRACRLVQRGAELIATNPDPAIPAQDGLEPGAGAILAAVEASTGVKATIVGKPNPMVYRLAMERLGTSIQETLVIGDRLETDIAGGQSLGCKTALVLSGVTSEQAARDWLPAPDLVARDLEQVLEIIRPGG
jgi:4-nitrophenyl phosphatase